MMSDYIPHKTEWLFIHAMVSVNILCIRMEYVHLDGYINGYT